MAKYENLKIKAYAKINLSLDVIRRRDDGYHDIETVMQAVDIYDEITVGVSGGYTAFLEGKIEFTADGNIGQDFPLDKKNLIVQAAELMKNHFVPSRRKNVKIHLTKKIPTAAGLGGGSADAAAVILALKRLWDIKVSLKDLLIISSRLGADIPFQLAAQAKLNKDLGMSDEFPASTCALAQGIGEILTPIKLDLSKYYIVLVKPNLNLSTGKIYSALDTVTINNRPNTAEIIEENNLIKNMINVLESVCINKYPIIMYTKNKLEDAEAVLMSGSGPSVFALYSKKEAAERAFEKIQAEYGEVFMTKAL